VTTTLRTAVDDFVMHKKALGRKYRSEEHELRLLVRFADARSIGHLGELTPGLLEDFLASRPRHRPRSFNHLLGVIRCFVDWTVSNQLLPISPLATRRRRVTSVRVPFLFDTTQAGRLLTVASDLPDNARAAERGSTYHASSPSATGSVSALVKHVGCAWAT
jgi:site-specific recombinase XerC